MFPWLVLSCMRGNHLVFLITIIIFLGISSTLLTFVCYYRPLFCVDCINITPNPRKFYTSWSTAEILLRELYSIIFTKCHDFVIPSKFCLSDCILQSGSWYKLSGPWILLTNNYTNPIINWIFTQWIYVVVSWLCFNV